MKKIIECMVIYESTVHAHVLLTIDYCVTNYSRVKNKDFNIAKFLGNVNCKFLDLRCVVM